MRKTKYCLGSGGSDRVIINRSKFGLVKNDYFISDVNGAQVIENKVHVNFNVSENIGGLKNQPVKNGAQVIENKAQSNFTFNGFFIEATY